ncbi:hypothetical protein B0A48_06561 [Cryoendolithus antarcticus]|uniref:4-oxalocrotonate tautomerase-like domain-containing protein n=1 Tax=Cryoendolithus antarcticus TaxID=1507870 RepID=A0A1V8TBR4_9PEZI|nr:hypothetical protein B0A48_06561 [Cryoendolithus antarcticus]
MPLIFIRFPEDTFSPENLDLLANQVTRDGEELEHLPLNDFVLSTTWVYARPYPKQHVCHGGKPGRENFISIDVNVINEVLTTSGVYGGYSAATKTELIKRVTASVAKYGDLPKEGHKRVFVLIREVAEANWGFDGGNLNLELLRDPKTFAHLPAL